MFSIVTIQNNLKVIGNLISNDFTRNFLEDENYKKYISKLKIESMFPTPFFFFTFHSISLLIKIVYV